ncbi:BA75_03849T0 [Komagataella pastoris]|uniref:BA75_03849T0 n=1 Tax=Komagataella pastoris TaxID=4922 RepID=A0A1B2JEF8_PICPA|nr:BA75_03849T0 [Komagataella pastoris]
MLSKSLILPIVSSLALANAAPKANAEALAAALPAPIAEAMAQALAQEDMASFSCHESCGYMILEARACAPDSNAPGVDFGPWDTDCLCGDGSGFEELVEPCLECGWCLWSDYGKYLVAPLEECGHSALPTGTECSEVASSATARVTAQISATLAALSLTTYPVSETGAATGAATSNSTSNSTTTSGTNSTSSSGSTTGSTSGSTTSGETTSATDGAAKLQFGAGVVGAIGAAAALLL